MKTISRLFILTFLLAACGPLNPVAPQPALTPGVYEYQDFAYDIVWSQDDSLAALTTITGLYVYDTKTYEQVFSFEEAGGSTSVFGEDYLASLDNHGVYIWDLKDFKMVLTVNGSFHSLAFSPEDEMIAIAEEAGIRFLSLPSGDVKSVLSTEMTFSDIKFKNKDSLIAANPFIGNVQEWDLKDEKMLHKFYFPRPVVSLRLSQDAALVLVDYGVTGFQLWDVAAGEIHHNYGEISSASGWQRLSGNNKYAVVWGYAFDGENSGMSVWDLDIHMHLQEFKTPFVNGDGWRCGSLNSDGSVLAASNNEGYVYFYDSQTGAEIGRFYIPYKFKIQKG